MATITLKGNPMQTSGDLPEVGKAAPDFTVTKTDLSDLRLKDLRGKRVILNVFPSLDTPVCSKTVRTFNEQASQLNNTSILCISADLPFAQKRFCTTENLNGVIPVSVFRNPSFAEQYGLAIISGPLLGLLARAVIVVDEKGKITYTELINEVSHEPNYQAAIQVLQ